MATAAGDLMCSFCLQVGESMSDSRKLMCGHAGCFPCIEGVFKTRKELECPICSFKSEVVDVNALEGIANNTTLSAAGDMSMCAICENERATVFCVRCQKLLCSVHHKEDDDRAEGGGFQVHHHVKTEVYLRNRDLYTRHYCQRHTGKKTYQACSNCLMTFCRSCDAKENCSSTDDLHKLTSLSDMATLLHTKVNEMQSSLKALNARCQCMLKDTYRNMDLFEKNARKIAEDVDMRVKHQIEQITLEGEKVKMDINKCRKDFSTRSEEQIINLKGCLEQAVQHMKQLYIVTNIRSPGHMLEKFSEIESRIQATLSTSLFLVRMPNLCLVPIGRFRRLEVKLSEISSENSDMISMKRSVKREENRRWITRSSDHGQGAFLQHSSDIEPNLIPEDDGLATSPTSISITHCPKCKSPRKRCKDGRWGKFCLRCRYNFRDADELPNASACHQVKDY